MAILGAVPQRYRYEFREGCLFLTCEEGEGVYRIGSWPEPRCMVRLLADAEWIPCPPPIRVLQNLRAPGPTRAAGDQLELGLQVDLRPSEREMKFRALRRFRECIPVAVARVVGKLRSLQWEVLVACSLSERFADLLTGNPALAYLWVSHCKERGFCQNGAVEVLGAQLEHGGETSQRQLLRHLALRSTRGTVRLLRKCHLPALHSDQVEALRTVLRDDRRMERLRHLPRLGTGILELARSTRILHACSPAMLSEIAVAREELHHPRTAARIKSHLALLDELGMPLPRPFRSREDLHRQHRDLANGFHELRRELEASLPPPPAPLPVPVRPAAAPVRPAATPIPPPPQRPRRKPDESLPSPPLPGNQHIVPLTTRGQLRAEGRAQSNCVASYFRRVRNGALYVYRVLWPERCTLSLVKRRNGLWILSELKTAHNKRASDNTRRLIEGWIRTSQHQLGTNP